MKNRNRNIFQRICVLTGVGLLVAAAILMFLWQYGIQTSAQEAATCVQALRMLMPEPQGALLEEHTDNSMPVLSLNGTDYIGILELPAHGSALPVCADWGHSSKQPCRFDGSIYDGTMQIGGTSQKGQYAFYREISVGDTVCFTDVTGNRYTYAVTGIRYEKHANQAAINREDAALVLFIKNIYAFEYVMIFCDVPNRSGY